MAGWSIRRIVVRLRCGFLVLPVRFDLCKLEPHFIGGKRSLHLKQNPQQAKLLYSLAIHMLMKTRLELISSGCKAKDLLFGLTMEFTRVRAGAPR